jgi:hypothetical protein
VSPRRILLGIASVATPVAIAIASTSPPPAAAQGAAPRRAPSPGAQPVLVELFTSEGCSSCPPADAVLARLERAQDAPGAEVVPLAFHVDYWDGIGWPDPFSAPWATARQRAYAPLGGGTYTPQAVVDGRAQVVGSRGAAVVQAVAEAAKRPHAPVAIGVARAGGGGHDAFDVTIEVGALPSDAATDADLLVAIAQRAARIAVPRGENAGRTLDHTAIARELRVLGPAAATGGSFATRVTPPKGLAAADARVVALVQERSSRRVLGASARALADR